MKIVFATVDPWKARKFEGNFHRKSSEMDIVFGDSLVKTKFVFLCVFFIFFGKKWWRDNLVFGKAILKIVENHENSWKIVKNSEKIKHFQCFWSILTKIQGCSNSYLFLKIE